MPSFKLDPFQKEAGVSFWEVARGARAKKEAGGAGEGYLIVQPTGAGKTIEILAWSRTALSHQLRTVRMDSGHESSEKAWKNEGCWHVDEKPQA